MAYTKNWVDESDFTSRWQINDEVTHHPAAVKFYSSRSGTKMEGWKEKIRNGQQASTPYSLDATKLVSKVPGTSTLNASIFRPPELPQVPPQYQNFKGYISYPGSNLGHMEFTQGKAEAKALSDLYSKIREEGQRLNSTATLAEFFSVVQQFGKPLDAIVDLSNRRLNRLELARKGLSGSTAFKRIKWSEIVASSYLEYSFGLSPLISDVRGVAEAFARWQYETTGDQRFRKRLTTRAEDVISRTDSSQTTSGKSGSWFVWDISHKTTTKQRVQYSVGMSSSIYADFGSNQRLLQLLGFTPENWVPGLYEAIPWTWLLDYFTNMQDILEAGVTSTAGVTWISKTVSTVSDLEMVSTVNGPSTSGYINAYGWNGGGGGSGGKYHIRRTSMNRTVPLSLGIPPLIYEHPFGNWRKSLNLAAVLLSKRASSSALWLF